MDIDQQVSKALRSRGLMLATAESCTGGLIAKLMTDKPGSSSVFERGFITYSNEAKIELLDIPEDVLNRYGAVSEQTARYMASGALKNSRADISVSVTGIAGPDGGSEEKQVGLVYIGYAENKKEAFASAYRFSGSRDKIRIETARAALQLILEQLGA